MLLPNYHVRHSLPARDFAGKISLPSAACGGGDGDWENLSQLFQDYYSAVTSHFTPSGDMELVWGDAGGRGGVRRLAAFVKKKKKSPHAQNISILDSEKIPKWKIKNVLNWQLEKV